MAVRQEQRGWAGLASSLIKRSNGHINAITTTTTTTGALCSLALFYLYLLSSTLGRSGVLDQRVFPLFCLPSLAML